MTKEYYEVHITLLETDKRAIENLRKEVEEHKWKFSVIDGDPTLGDGIKCYATRHYNVRKGEDTVLNELMRFAVHLSKTGYQVIRRKIEKVIFDDRSDTVTFKCNGGCFGCHLDDYVDGIPTSFGDGML